MTKADLTSNVICFESQAFYAVIEEVVERIKDKIPVQHEKWIGDGEAMKLLRINPKTTLQKYRDEGKIRYSQPGRKLILYDRRSILDFIEQHARKALMPVTLWPGTGLIWQKKCRMGLWTGKTLTRWASLPVPRNMKRRCQGPVPATMPPIICLNPRRTLRKTGTFFRDT